MGCDDQATVERQSKGIIDYKLDGNDAITAEIKLI